MRIANDVRTSSRRRRDKYKLTTLVIIMTIIGIQMRVILSLESRESATDVDVYVPRLD